MTLTKDIDNTLLIRRLHDYHNEIMSLVEMWDSSDLSEEEMDMLIRQVDTKYVTLLQETR